LFRVKVLPGLGLVQLAWHFDPTPLLVEDATHGCQPQTGLRRQ
jgi:hypothetical protein